jgi:hypothetical protein
VTFADLPPDFAASRDAFHTLAEYVVSPARHRMTGRIGLVATPGGFGTPEFGEGERVRVDGVELVHEHPGSTRRVHLSTLAAAADFLGIPLGPTGVYTPVTALAPDAELAVGAESAAVLAHWYAFATEQLENLRAVHATFAPTPVQLWPEHFDLATDFEGADASSHANYGASAGDELIPEPYLYVGPWDAARRVGALATQPFGAACTRSALVASGDPERAATEFFADAAALLVG